MTGEHLTNREVAQWLANANSGPTQDESLARHVAQCEACRRRIDRGDAMLDLAGALLADESESSDCPEAIQIAGYVEGNLVEADAARLKAHFNDCSACTSLLDRLESSDTEEEFLHDSATASHSSRKSMRFWLAGVAILAAAAIAIVAMLPEPSVVALAVNVVAASNSRSSQTQSAANEFEVVIHLRKPEWITLLVVDSKGELTYLEDRRLESSATMGRYSTRSPEPVGEGGSRKFVVVLVSAESLKSKLVDVDIDPVTINDDAHANSIAMDGLCKILSKRLSCDAQSAPIGVPAAGE